MEETVTVCQRICIQMTVKVYQIGNCFSVYDSSTSSAPARLVLVLAEPLAGSLTQINDDNFYIYWSSFRWPELFRLSVLINCAELTTYSWTNAQENCVRKTTLRVEGKYLHEPLKYPGSSWSSLIRNVIYREHYVLRSTLSKSLLSGIYFKPRHFTG